MGQEIRDAELLGKIAVQLKQIRKERDITQDIFFYDTNIHIARIETGKVNVSVSTLKAICDYFEISIVDFFESLEPESESENENEVQDLEAQLRYFLVAFDWSDGDKVGFGRIVFGGDGFPSNKWVLEQAARSNYPNACVNNIFEFNSKEDYEAFISTD